MLDVTLAERFSFQFLECEIVSHCLQRRKTVIYYALVAAEVVHLGVRHFWLPAVARLLQKGAHRYNRVFYVEDDVRALPCWDLSELPQVAEGIVWLGYERKGLLGFGSNVISFSASGMRALCMMLERQGGKWRHFDHFS